MKTMPAAFWIAWDRKGTNLNGCSTKRPAKWLILNDGDVAERLKAAVC
jgi:hypothetical protein